MPSNNYAEAYTSMNDRPIFPERNEPDRYTKQDPPKWLSYPVALNADNHIKVFDFKDGTANDEMRKTNDTDIEYECDLIENPVLKIHTVDVLERKMQKKQEKRIIKFEEEEEKRMEEAKRSGSIIEDFSNQARDGMQEPLLANNRSDSDDPEAQNLINNNQNLVGEERVFL
jgi:hypothetical protein